MENNNMNWQEELNKKLEEQRNAYKESLESGEVTKRKIEYVQKIRSKAGAIAAAGKGGKVTAEKYGNAAFLKEWSQDNPEEFKESCVRGGITQGNKSKEEGTGLFSLTDEERSINAKLGNQSFWDNATSEEIKAKYDKASDSMKEHIKENGWWNPHQYITPELQKEMTKKQRATKLNQREQRIKDLYDAINTNDWFTLEYATDVLSSTSKKGASESTTRRMIHGWSEASKYYEYRRTELSDEGRPYMQWRKK